MQQLLTKGTKATAMLWSPLQSAYKLVHQAAEILANHQQQSGMQVRERYLRTQVVRYSRKPSGRSFVISICSVPDCPRNQTTASGPNS